MKHIVRTATAIVKRHSQESSKDVFDLELNEFIVSPEKKTYRKLLIIHVVCGDSSLYLSDKSTSRKYFNKDELPDFQSHSSCEKVIFLAGMWTSTKKKHTVPLL